MFDNRTTSQIKRWSLILAKTVALISLQSPLSAQAQECSVETITATTPTSRYVVNNDGTVTDVHTGLMWKQCAEGKSGSNCSLGDARIFTWQAALQAVQTQNAAGGFASYTDWRIPNIKELRSMTERQCYDPAINLAVFPNAASTPYWSSTPLEYAVWGIDFIDGRDSWFNPESEMGLRLVRDTN